jgi:AAHS family 4-hydroxybenzoate transporter-like MFS transporter
LNYLVRKGAKAQKRLVSTVLRLRPDLQSASQIRVEAPGSQSARGGVRALFGPGLALTTWLLWVVFFMSLLDIYMLVSWVPTALHVAGAAPTAAITAGILLQVGAIVASFPIGWALDRFGVVATLAPSYLLAVICIAAIGSFSYDIQATLIIAFGAGFGLIGGQAGANAVATVSYPPDLRSTGAGWALGIGRIGSIIGPAVGGVLLNAHVAIQHIFFLTALPALIATLAVIGLSFRPSAAALPLGQHAV